jgi:hypothetical protein
VARIIDAARWGLQMRLDHIDLPVVDVSDG